MNFVPKQINGDVKGVHVAEDFAGLQIFLENECAAAVMRRQIPQHFQTWLDNLEVSSLPRGRAIMPAEAIGQGVSSLCDVFGLAEGPERAWLVSDIASLAEMFADLMSAKFLRLRLDVISTNACRKFHVDAISARLVCTYRGTGTQYGLGAAEREPESISTVQTGDPILLRGTLFPEQPPSGLLHRSPPIEGTGETRLVLVLDPSVGDEGRV